MDQGEIDIYVTRENPLIIRKTSDRMSYRTICMEPGSYIEIRVGSKFTVGELVQSDEHLLRDSFPENQYPTLLKGEERTEWDYHMIVTGTPGNDGKNGKAGQNWGESGKPGETADSGGDAPDEFTITIRELGFDVTILSVGGKGGKGGKGGDGANGYDGESASDPGGIGGDGGDGGSGGNGGNAASNVTVRYASLHGYEPSVTCRQADGGNGGMKGIHGRNGKYYNGNSQPEDGNSGSGGTRGGKGKFSIEKITS